MIIFYYSPLDPFSRAVKMVATHLNIPMQEVNVEPYIGTKTEEFKKINPGHLVPTINDDGFILWESRAIMQYLCNKYAPDSSLYPKDPKLRSTVDRLLYFDLKTLSPAVLAAHFEFTLKSELSASRHDIILAVTDALTFIEITLIGHDYVAGDQLTIADFSILSSVTMLEVAVEFELSSYPNIWGWINRLRRELPYFDTITKIAFDELRKTIKEIRDYHDEWSPRKFCIFCTENKEQTKNGKQQNGNPSTENQHNGNPLTHTSYNSNPFTVNPFTVNPFTVNPFTVNPFTVNPFNTHPYNVDDKYNGIQ